MSASDELTRIVPPLDNGKTPSVDWAAFEESLGTRLPEDYKWLVDTYGYGKFDDFLCILQPESPSKYTRLKDSASASAEMLAKVDAHESIPYPVDDLIPVAKTDNGDTIYWISSPRENPDAWVVVGNGARNQKWPRHDGGIVEFLAAVLSRRIYFDIFPQDFPSDNPEFSRFPSMKRR